VEVQVLSSALEGAARRPFLVPAVIRWRPPGYEEGMTVAELETESWRCRSRATSCSQGSMSTSGHGDEDMAASYYASVPS
jgi:hypothetical protein